MRRSSDRVRELIKSTEELRTSPYKCPAGVATIGYGTTVYPNGKRVRTTDHPITKEKAEAYFNHSVGEVEKSIERLVTAPLQDCMFDALVSFVYNIGVTKFAASTLLKRLNQCDYLAACDEMAKWHHVNGKDSNGLIKRRAAEIAMFRGENWD